MSFAGRGIVVTRPRELAAPLVRLIEGRGGRAIVFPVIEIEPLAPPPVLGRIAEFDIVVFVSPSAVKVALLSMPPWPPGVAAAAVGAGTRRELERAGVADVLAPSEGADSEALLALPRLQQVSGKRILIVRGQGGRALLADALAARGARVQYAECYRRARPAIDAAALVAQWRRGEVDALTAFSAQGLDNFIAMAGAGILATTPLFVSHARVARHAASLGIRGAVVAGPGDDQMIARLVAYFDERN